MTQAIASAFSSETLRGALQSSVESLRMRRAAEIPEGYIDAYVRLQWLEWDGGWLRLTPTGENMCRQVLAQPSPADLTVQGSRPRRHSA